MAEPGTITTVSPARKGPSVLIHGLILCLAYLSPVFFELTRSGSWERSWQMVLFQTFPVLFFYVNYAVLVPRFLMVRKGWRFAAWNILLLALLVVLQDQVIRLLLPVAPPDGFGAPRPPLRPLAGGPPPWQGRGMPMFRHLASFIMAGGLGVAVRMTVHWYHAEALRKEQEKSRLESELNHLKLQLNPHFFFNTLNNIYALIGQDTERARDAVHQLSGLMRYLLQESDTFEVPLARETVFLQNYITLMRIRLPERVRLDVRLPERDPAGEWQVPPLLFISLVENAFKHGIGADEDCYITIALTAGPGQLTFRVENSVPRRSASRSGQRTGIGLVNLRKRLELVYPGLHSLETIGGEGVYTAVLEIRHQGA